MAKNIPDTTNTSYIALHAHISHDLIDTITWHKQLKLKFCFKNTI